MSIVNKVVLVVLLLFAKAAVAAGWAFDIRTMEEESRSAKKQQQTLNQIVLPEYLQPGWLMPKTEQTSQLVPFSMESLSAESQSEQLYLLASKPGLLEVRSRLKAKERSLLATQWQVSLSAVPYDCSKGR